MLQMLLQAQVMTDIDSQDQTQNRKGQGFTVFDLLSFSLNEMGESIVLIKFIIFSK